jgi:hypothetical protein
MGREGNMHPSSLIAPSSPLGFPAPYWFLVVFKVIGFVLHMTMMNLWFAGPILALVMYYCGHNARHLSSRLMKAMPIIIAYGINFGIVPLLFVQVAYHKVFYPSSILMAWAWFSIIIMLTFAYYGAYIYATALKKSEDSIAIYKKAAGWISAALFIIIGFIFTNEFSLMTNLSTWPALYRSTDFNGAVTGLALNTGDSTLWARWLMIFGLAITTTAAYLGIDTGLFARKENNEYRRWASEFPVKLYTAGVIWYGLAASWYIFGTWADDVKTLMLSGPFLVLTILTALSMALPGLLLLIGAIKKEISKAFGILLIITQVVVLSLNGISRQIVQNAELARYFDLTADKVHIQWSPMILFLILFVLGALLIIWMIRQAILSSENSVI